MASYSAFWLRQICVLSHYLTHPVSTLRKSTYTQTWLAGNNSDTAMCMFCGHGRRCLAGRLGIAASLFHAWQVVVTPPSLSPFSLFTKKPVLVLSCGKWSLVQFGSIIGWVILIRVYFPFSMLPNSVADCFLWHQSAFLLDMFHDLMAQCLQTCTVYMV